MTAVEACRMCLAVDKRLYLIANTPLEDIYEKMTGRLFQSGNGKPVMACYICYHILTKWMTFVERTLKVDDMLQQMVDCGIEIKQRTISSIDSAYLKPPLIFSFEYSFDYPETPKKIKVTAIDSLEIKNELWEECENAVESTVHSIEDFQVEDLLQNYSEPDGITKLKEVKIEDIDNCPSPSVSEEVENKREESSKAQGESLANTHNLTVPSYLRELLSQRESSSIQKVACTFCGEFFDKDSVKEHENQHTQKNVQESNIEEKPHVCQHCSKAFTQKVDLDDHVKLHTEENSYDSVHCNKPFQQECESTLRSYMNAVMKHTKKDTTRDKKKKEFTCNICNKSFAQKRYLRSHSMLHAAEKSYSCHLCGESFTKPFMLQRHIAGHRGNSGEKTFKCDTCGQSFSKKDDLESHMSTHETQPFKCDACSEVFTSKGSLNIHKLTHGGEKAYRCNQCDKSFVMKHGLKIHMISHTKEKKYPCTICGKVYKHSSSLANHMEVHSERNRLCCDLCGKGVKNNRNLRNHMKMHSVLEPIQIHLVEPQVLNIEMTGPETDSL